MNFWCTNKNGKRKKNISQMFTILFLALFLILSKRIFLCSTLYPHILLFLPTLFQFLLDIFYCPISLQLHSSKNILCIKPSFNIWWKAKRQSKTWKVKRESNTNWKRVGRKSKMCGYRVEHRNILFDKIRNRARNNIVNIWEMFFFLLPFLLVHQKFIDLL
jgi:hypothetical protein